MLPRLWLLLSSGLAVFAPLSAWAQGTCTSIFPPQLITFTEYPLGTSITVQYQTLGVVFSGSSPFISEDASNPTAPVLSGTPRFQGPVTAEFVNPSKPTESALAKGVEFDAGYFDAPASTTITYFDAAHAVIGSAQNTGTGIEHFTAPGPIHGFTVQITSEEPAGFAIDNLAFQLQPTLVVRRPAVNDSFSVDQSDHTATGDIPFESADPGGSGHVNWTATVNYTTSGGRGAFQNAETFQAPVNTTTNRTYAGQGGRMKVEAVERVNGQGADKTACPVEYTYIVGTPIPDAEITARLIELYGGATPNLLTGIAAVESSYRQFAGRTLFSFNALWPNESYDGGSHVGLMQMPTNQANAWDWQANTSNAARLFDDKIRAARRLEGRMRRPYKDLNRLSDVQIENVALVLYGPHASASLNMQYYTVQVSDNNVQWIVNTANNGPGVAYADNVRGSIR